MSAITTHVLDTSTGNPARGVALVLDWRNPTGEWMEMGRGVTNQDGRVTNLLAEGPIQTGVYRLSFDTASYFRNQGIEGFYPHVPVVFEVRDGQQHFHVPLLLNPFGYSTYRGS
jgi:5-hydroxyisourate hydrolase